MTSNEGKSRESSRGRGRTSSNRRRYLSYLIYLTPIVAILLSYFAISFVTQEPNPFTIVTGTSMTPTIPPGTVAVISKVPFDQLKVGDVIVFIPLVVEQNGGSCVSSAGSNLVYETSTPCFVIHRIVRIDNTSRGEIITTKGDNNPTSIGPPDSPPVDVDINQSMYVGKVVLILPYVGYLTVSPYNEYAAAVILLALVAELFWERKGGSSSSTQS